MPGLTLPRTDRATLPSPPPPDSWPAQAAAAAPPRPLSGASLAPGQRRTGGTRMMLGVERGKGKGPASGLGYFGEHISSLHQGPIPTAAAPQRAFLRGHSPRFELPPPTSHGCKAQGTTSCHHCWGSSLTQPNPCLQHRMETGFTTTTAPKGEGERWAPGRCK